MRTSNQCIAQEFTTPQCCFIPFFSQNLILSPNHQRNTNGLITSLKSNQQFMNQKEIIFTHLKQKITNQTIKRSISNIKEKKRITNRESYVTQNNITVQKIQLNAQKTKSSLRNSDILQRYLSPKAPHTGSLVISQTNNQKKMEPYFNRQNIQLNRNAQQSTKIHPFFKHQQVINSIQFSKPYRTEYIKTGPCISVNQIKNNLSKVTNNQTINNTDLKLQIPSTATHFDNSQRFNYAQKPKENQPKDESIEINNKDDNPQEIFKNLEEKNQKRSSRRRKTSIQKALQGKNQQNNLQTQLLEVPMNPFKHIESFVVQVKRQKDSEDQQRQYESIKTKGRAVQSMLQHTKDLAKTKKVRKDGKRRNQTGLNDLENMTVTSQYEEEEDRDRVQKIEESAVLLNFFNPPKDVKDRLDLSKHHKPSNERSGFY